MRNTLLLLVYFSCPMFAQDTLKIYFDVNSAKISENDQDSLRMLSTRYDLASVDSAHFIGYADSTGNLKSNLRLSERRANNVYKTCEPFLQGKTAYRLLAMGENIRSENWQSRRVEIILFYKNATATTDETDEVIEDVDPKCFFVDFEALEYCHVREFTKNRQTYVQLEALEIPLFKTRKHYYAITDTKGKTTVRRLNWKLKTTGRFWWRKTRWVATMPKESFEKFQFFTLDDAPCSGCSETILTKDTIIRTQLKYYPDLFLMDNLQTKVQFFGQNKVKIRAPKEYVDLTENYYYSTDAYSVNANYPISWTEKNGKKKQNYYYSTMRTSLSDPVYIKKCDYTTVCLNKYEYSAYRKSWSCGGVIGPGMPYISFRIAPGAFFHNDTLTAFVTGGIFLRGLSLNAGLNHRGGFYGSVYYNRSIFSFPLSVLSPKNKWHSISQLPRARRFFVLYGGGELRTSFTKNYQSFLEGNLHLGTRLWYFGSPRFRLSLFLQGGFAYDFLRHINTSIYSYAECGLRIDLPVTKN